MRQTLTRRVAWQRAWRDLRWIAPMDEMVRAATLEVLLTKRTMREKDRQDCVVIERAIAVLNATDGGLAPHVRQAD